MTTAAGNKALEQGAALATAAKKGRQRKRKQSGAGGGGGLVRWVGRNIIL